MVAKGGGVVFLVTLTVFTQRLFHCLGLLPPAEQRLLPVNRGPLRDDQLIDCDVARKSLTVRLGSPEERLFAGGKAAIGSGRLMRCAYEHRAGSSLTQECALRTGRLGPGVAREKDKLRPSKRLQLAPPAPPQALKELVPKTPEKFTRPNKRI